jgi:selenophosphate synthetase-related protein
VHERARVSRREWRTVGKSAVAPRKDEDAVYTALRSPDDLLVIAAGGPAGGFAAILPPWYGRKSLAVTKGIDA